MARIRKPRLALAFVIGELRKVIKDPNTPAWLKIASLDRLAFIDKIYEVELQPVTQRVAKLPAPKAEEIPQQPVEEPPMVVDTEGAELLDSFNRRFYNKGE